MNVTCHHVKDIEALRDRIGKESNAKQRDRYRVILLALEGLGAKEIAARLSRCRNFVQRWVYVYRDHGLEAVVAKKQPGPPTKLPAEEEQAFLAQLASSEGILRGRDIAALLEESFGVTYTVQGAYDLLHRLGYEPLKPRPVNPKKNPEDEAAWKEAAPLLCTPSGKNTLKDTSRSGSRMNVDSDKRDA